VALATTRRNEETDLVRRGDAWRIAAYHNSPAS
jgi:hypothetical protein